MVWGTRSFAEVLLSEARNGVLCSERLCGLHAMAVEVDEMTFEVRVED